MTGSKMLLAGAAIAALSAAGLSGYALTDPARAAGAAPLASGRVDNFRLASADLQSYELDRMADAPAVVILTQQNGCKASQVAAASLQGLKAKYHDKGVEFLMLNSSLTDGLEATQGEAARIGGDIPILRDVEQLVGENLGVKTAGEAIVVNPKTWQVVWRGAMDARSGAQVLDSVLSGAPIKASAKAARGCAIDFPARAHAAEFAKISYVKDIAPIIEGKCVECHQQGSIGPMELTSYEKVKGFAPMIREVIRTDRMPPFQTERAIGHFEGDKRLSDAQVKTLVHWIEAGAPRGEGADPLAQVKHVAPEWPLGKPDLVLDIPAYTVPATGVVDYQHPWTANPLTEGRWVRASTIKPGARQAVHHILTGYMEKVPEAGTKALENRWKDSLGTYAVGGESEINPDNVGVYLPAGGAVGFQNHYTPYGKEVTDKSQIALYFYPKDKPPQMVMHQVIIAQQNIEIPPGEERHKEVAYLTFPKDAVMYTVFFHAHYRGASARLDIQYADGRKKTLASLPRYDFNWQRDYNFAQPIKIPAGARLITTYVYDNSKRNPANPDPKKTITWGPQSWEEMHYTQVRYRWEGETASQRVDYDKALNAGRAIGILDTNLDGKVQESELRGLAGKQLKARFAQMDANHDGVLDENELKPVAAALSRRED
jgi:hypothetical protein